MKNKIHSAEQFTEQIIQKRINAVRLRETPKISPKKVFVDSKKMLRVLIGKN